MVHSRWWLGAAVAALHFFPADVCGQTIAGSFGELQRLVKAAETVVVTDAAGTTVRGTVAELSASSLTILAPERRTYFEGTVTEIRRSDAVWNGMQYGFWAGLGAYVIALNVAARTSDDFPYRFAYIGLPMFAAGGALIGMGIDHGVGGEQVYRARGQRSGTPRAVTPSSGGSGISLSVALRF